LHGLGVGNQKDPFEGEWEQITSWLMANPERSSDDIFRELQRRSPGRYQPLQIRTLQRGMRKIRAYLLETVEEQWQAEVIHGRSPSQFRQQRIPPGVPDRQLSKLLWKIFDEAIFHFLSPYWGFPTLFSAMQCILSLERPSCHHGSCTELSVRNMHD
jgi:hypothetical protein